MFVPYERDARHAGRTHFPFFSRNPWKTFALGLTSFSFMPVYVCLMLAAAGRRLRFCAAGAGGSRRGSMAGLLVFLWAVLMAAVAIVGVYVIRIYKDVRGRPALHRRSRRVGFEVSGRS